MCGGDVPVLVVDDQPLFRRAASTVVALTPGFRAVGQAASGESALDLVEELHPQLVLMDINMGAMNGIEATRRITAAHPGVVVVLLSTYQVDDLPADAASSGMAAYINKDEFGPSVLRSVWDHRADAAGNGAAKAADG